MVWNCAKHLRRQKSILITCSQCRQWMIVITKRFCTRSFLGGRRLVMEGCLIKWSFCAWYHAQCLNFHTEHFVSQYVVDHVSQNGVHKTMMVWVGERPWNVKSWNGLHGCFGCQFPINILQDIECLAEKIHHNSFVWQHCIPALSTRLSCP